MKDDTSVAYMERTRAYYAAQGYDKPYKWSHFDDIPFARPRRELSDCTATIVTTSMPDESYRKEHRRLHIGDLGNPPEKFFTGDLSWDRDATHTEDRDSYFPVRELERRVAAGELGRLAPRFYCVPTQYSQRHTIERDAPAIVAGCVEDAVDVALLVPL